MKSNKVTANTAHLDTTLLVNDAMTALQVVSFVTAAPPQPKHVQAVLTGVAQQIANDLTSEVLAAREGCKRKQETIDRQLGNLVQLNQRNDELTARNFALEKEVRAQRLTARGNVVLVRRDGFSKPMEIAPCRSFGPEPAFPHYIKAYDCPRHSGYQNPSAAVSASAHLETLQFALTTEKDGFGRRIYVQV